MFQSKYFSVIFLLIIIFFIGCRSQRNTIFVPVPDDSFFEFEENVGIEFNDIISSKDGTGAESIPAWLRSYISGGNRAVERLNAYGDKYVFIGSNRGNNFTVLSLWLDFFSVTHDVPLLVTARIERRMILQASLYPDDEYGLFFENMIKNASSAEYPGVFEDTYWIKIKDENDEEIYLFFILISIDRMELQAIITKMMDDSMVETPPPVMRRRQRNFHEIAAAQAAAVNNLRQNFFMGF